MGVGLTSSPLTTASPTAITSTPKRHVTSLTGGSHNSSTSMYGMSLGLAAILNDRDLGLTRVAMGHGLRHAASIPSHLPTVTSSETTHDSTTRSHVVSVSQSLKDLSRVGLSSAATASRSSPAEGASGILDRIKQTGFSLYGYIGGRNSPDGQDSAGVGTATTGIICDTDQIESLESPGDGGSKHGVHGDSGSVLGMLTSFRRGGFL